MKIMSEYYVEEYSFLVIGYHLKDGKAKLDNLFGTASYMNNNVFVCAAHSIKNAQESEFAGIAFRDNMSSNTYTYHYFKEAEIFEDFDIGIFKLHNGHKNANQIHSHCRKYLHWKMFIQWGSHMDMNLH